MPLNNLISSLAVRYISIYCVYFCPWLLFYVIINPCKSLPLLYFIFVLCRFSVLFLFCIHLISPYSKYLSSCFHAGTWYGCVCFSHVLSIEFPYVLSLLFIYTSVYGNATTSVLSKLDIFIILYFCISCLVSTDRLLELC